MSVLARDIAAFTRMRAELEAHHLKAWVVFHEGQFEGAFPDFETAAESAQARFDRGPYLIRQVGAGPVQFSGGMILRPVYANGRRGLAAAAAPKAPPTSWSSWVRHSSLT